MAESTQAAAKASEEGAQADKDLAVEKKGLAEDTTYLRELKRDCQTRAGEFEVETKDNNAELGALAKAKAIMLKKFGGASLVQLGARARVAVRSDADDKLKAKALRSIEQLGRRLHRTALI